RHRKPPAKRQKAAECRCCIGSEKRCHKKSPDIIPSEQAVTRYDIAPPQVRPRSSGNIMHTLGKNVSVSDSDFDNAGWQFTLSRDELNELAALLCCFLHSSAWLSERGWLLPVAENVVYFSDSHWLLRS